jgi:stage II sporulation protein D
MATRKLGTVAISACAVFAGLMVPLAPQIAQAAPLVPASFDISGSGFGHGVGLSQYGARGMALAGYTADRIVKHYYVNTKIGVETEPTTLRVGLAQDQQYVALQGEALGGKGGHLTVNLGTQTKTLDAGSPVVFSISGGNARATFSDGTAAVGKTATITWNGTSLNGESPSVANVATSYSATAAKSALGAACKDTFNGVVITGFDSCPHRYRYGSLEIAAGQFADNTTDLNIVNTLRLSDEYLYGLGEVPSSWEPAALGAQVIAARSYALATYNATVTSPSAIAVAGTKVRAACLCHMYSTIVDQNFVGYNKEYSVLGTRWVDAVNSTIPVAGSGMGKVVLYQNKVIKAFFSSSTGGASQPIKEVWGSSGYPWSAVVDDHWALGSKTGNPNISWVRKIKQGELIRSLNNVGITIKNVKTFVISDLYPSGGVSKIIVTDANGKATNITVGPTGRVTPDTLRWVLGVKSTYLRSVKPSASLIKAPNSDPTPIPTATVSASTKPTISPKPTPTPLRSITDVVWPAKRIAPGSFSITGGLDPKSKNVDVTLSEEVDDVWTVLAATKTGIDGSFVLPWDKTVLGTHVLKISATTPVNSVETPPVTLNVIPFLTIAGPTTGRVQKSVILKGSLLPTTPNVTVTIWRQIGHGQWKATRTTRTNKDGQWGVVCGVGSAPATAHFVAKITDPVLGTTKSPLLTLVIS